MRIWIFIAALYACNPVQRPAAAVEAGISSATDTLQPAAFDATGQLVKVFKTEAEWKKILSEKEFYVLRQEGTEYAFSGDLWNHHGEGTYICRGCGLPLFASDTKFDSGTGWPSYWKPIDPKFVTENTDNSHGMTRVEVECARCGGHLGHVFDDGPKPTGLRYCINSVSLDFVKK